jgi:hypothetical protein
VTAIPRSTTLTYKKKTTNNNRVPFIITHNPTHPPVAQWLKELMPTLHRSRRMQKAMPEAPIVGERISRNLKQMLMPSSLPRPKPAEAEPAGCTRCTAKRCILCQEHLQQTTTFSSVRTGQRFQIRDHVDCKSTNVIYLIDCAKCHDVQYVGETGQTVSRRFHGHRSSIKQQGNSSTNDSSKRETLVARHFQGQGHTLQHLRVTVIEQVQEDNTNTRRKRERFWRHKLKTNYPEGLNVWD